MKIFFDFIKWQNVAGVKELLENGVDPNKPEFPSEDPNKGENFPLILAAETGNLELVKLLVAHGAKVNVSAMGDGQTPLHAAFDRNYSYQRPLSRNEEAEKTTKMVHYLVSLGADINAEGGFCLTPFLLAIDSVRCNDVDIDILQYLIDHGADVNKVLDGVDENEARTTPLGAAIAVDRLDLRGHYPTLIDWEIVALLIKNGADPSINPQAFYAPLEEALEIQKKLQKDSELIQQLSANNDKIIDILTRYGAKTEYTDDKE